MNRFGLTIIAATCIPFWALVGCAMAHAQTLDLQAFNRAENRAYPLNNRPLAWADEGKDGYNCKGFVTLKARDLNRLGVSYDRMRSLSVAPNHRVLEVDGVILDNLSAWLNKPTDYRIIGQNDIRQDINRMGLQP